MDSLQIVLDNEGAINDSFMYYLHERGLFEIEQFNILCEAIKNISHNIDMKEDRRVAYKIHFIHNQIIYHILYHFNPDDLSCIKNLPPNFYEHLNELDTIVKCVY